MSLMHYALMPGPRGRGKGGRADEVGGSYTLPSLSWKTTMLPFLLCGWTFFSSDGSSSSRSSPDFWRLYVPTAKKDGWAGQNSMQLGGRSRTVDWVDEMLSPPRSPILACSRCCSRTQVSSSAVAVCLCFPQGKGRFRPITYYCGMSEVPTYRHTGFVWMDGSIIQGLRGWLRLTFSRATWNPVFW